MRRLPFLLGAEGVGPALQISGENVNKDGGEAGRVGQGGTGFSNQEYGV